MNILRALARPMLAAPFIVDGVSALRDPDEHVERAEPIRPLLARALPDRTVTDEQLRLATRALGGVTACAGACFALGKAPRAAAAVLTAVAVPMALVNNPVWEGGTRVQRRDRTNGLIARLGLVGGLAIASMDREGRPSAAWRLAAWRDERSRLAAARQKERARYTDSSVLA
ncbi:DoxX family membrane protein [Actinomyces sp. B33]|uniref:DoxX family membrane protein n=1 Tax=Actinomyces sp. B33 TaxID=2942131 RepID=UPI00233FE148|nr:DoxX family membrane protein [Actinomyces sp. B33]MDC4232691.1 DoxX family membrane protein [Actinomyces sp. B33]